MKKIAIFSILAFAAIVMISACKAKPAETPEPPKEVPVLNITPENLVALVNAEWNAVPQDLLDAMGVKPLNSFFQEVKDAQCDIQHYYYGNGASVELDKDGQLVKVDSDDDNGVVVYLTAESVAYGTIGFRSEADYNEFLKKAQAIKESKEKAGQEVDMEFVGIGKNVGSEDRGYDEGEWYFVEYTYNK